MGIIRHQNRLLFRITNEARLTRGWFEAYCRSWSRRGESVAQWLETVMANELKKLSIEELRALDFDLVMQAQAAVRAELRARGIEVAPPSLGTPELIISGDLNARYAKLPLVDVIPEYLANCKKPQTTKRLGRCLSGTGWLMRRGRAACWLSRRRPCDHSRWEARVPSA